jgi:hypothetical protein
VFRADDLRTQIAGLAGRQFHDATGSRRNCRGLGVPQTLTATNDLLDATAEILQRCPELGQDAAGGAALAHQTQQQMLWPNHRVTELAALLSSVMKHQACPVIVSVHSLPRDAA